MYSKSEGVYSGYERSESKRGGPTQEEVLLGRLSQFPTRNLRVLYSYLYRMDTDSLLLPHCDISGSCLIFRCSIRPTVRPYITWRLSKKLPFLPWDGNNYSLARWIFFTRHPEISKKVCVTISCGNPHCVRASHIQYGVLNPDAPSIEYPSPRRDLESVPRQSSLTPLELGLGLGPVTL